MVDECLFPWDEINLNATLSMDVTRSFFAPMGLTFTPRDDFIHALRDSLEVTWADIESADEDEDPIARRVHVTEIHQALLRDRLGCNFAIRFRKWTCNVCSLSKAQDKSFDVYKTALQIWAAAYRKCGIDEIGFELGASRVYKLRQRLTSINDLIEDIANVKTVPLTSWDSLIYGLMGFFNDEKLVYETNIREDEIVLRYPFHLMMDTSENHRFRVFWEVLCSELPECDLNSLHLYAKHKAQKWHPKFSNNLIFPSDLRWHDPWI